MAKSSSTNSRMESDDDDEAPEALGGEAVDASVGASISCAKQRTVRPKALPYPTTVNDIGSSEMDSLRYHFTGCFLLSEFRILRIL